VAPKRLFYEAFSLLHKQMKLPALEMQNLNNESSPQALSRNNSHKAEANPGINADEEEAVSLIGKER
jgi:hypothetical protein